MKIKNYPVVIEALGTTVANQNKRMKEDRQLIEKLYKKLVSKKKTIEKLNHELEETEDDALDCLRDSIKSSKELLLLIEVLTAKGIDTENALYEVHNLMEAEKLRKEEKNKKRIAEGQNIFDFINKNSGMNLKAK